MAIVYRPPPVVSRRIGGTKQYGSVRLVIGRSSHAGFDTHGIRKGKTDESLWQKEDTHRAGADLRLSGENWSDGSVGRA